MDFNMPEVTDFLASAMASKPDGAERSRADELEKVINLAKECKVKDVEAVFNFMLYRLYPEPLRANDAMGSILGVVGQVIGALKSRNQDDPLDCDGDNQGDEGQASEVL